jgi:hypothetical protein
VCLQNYRRLWNISNSTQQRPSWEASSRSASQEIPRLLWNLKVRYPILSGMNPVHSLTNCSFKIHFHIHPLLFLVLPSDLFPSGFPTKTFYACLICPVRVTWPAHLTLIKFGETNVQRNMSQCLFVHHKYHSLLWDWTWDVGVMRCQLTGLINNSCWWKSLKLRIVILNPVIIDSNSSQTADTNQLWALLFHSSQLFYFAKENSR